MLPISKLKSIAHESVMIFSGEEGARLLECRLSEQLIQALLKT